MSVRVTDKDLGWKAFFQNVADMVRDQKKIKVGVLEDSAKGSVPVAGGSITMAELAVVHEFGTEDGRIPARSFIGSTFDEQRDNLLTVSKNLVKDCLFAKQTVDGALEILGAQLVEAVKDKINSGDITPPNTESTIERKGSDTPLLDTGALRDAVSYKLSDKDEK